MATLVTGLGYIGSALVSRLLDDGEDVVGLDNFFSTPRENIAPLTSRGLRLVEGSISDPATVEAAFTTGSIETVFHLAAQASAQPTAAPLAYTQETNYTGPRVLLDACLKHGVRRVVMASSMRIYRVPLPDTLSEDAPLGPTDLVHLSHLYCELLLDAYWPLGIAGAAARVGIVHGVSPVMKTDQRFLAVPQRFCLRAARGEALEVAAGPTTEVPLVHIDDAVAGLLCLRDAPPSIRVANIAAEVRSAVEIANAVRSTARSRGIEVEVQYRSTPQHSPHRVASALELLGFEPKRTVEEGVGEVLDHYVRVVRAHARANG